MVNRDDPRQIHLFDEFRAILSPLAYKRLLHGWQGVFRHVILELMPVDAVAGEFHPTMGRPTKELYSMAGLLLIKEFNDWTTAESADEYMFDAGVQYALNRPPANQSLSERTVERYEKIFVENDLAARVMDDVTVRLADELELDTSRQRIDSTHVFSDMATFGRTRLMGVTIKRFLRQLKRHSREAYDALPAALRDRYAPSAAKMFGDVAKDKDSRRKLRQDVAEDMLFLVEQFADDASVNGRTTYATLAKVFGEQCEVVDGAIEVKKHTGGDVIQNPSDPDATYDGHKGPGYQAQFCETCSDDNEVEILTGVIPQTAAEDDQDAPAQMLDDLEEKGMLPEVLYGDTHYGSDENVEQCAERGVDLQSPVSGKDMGESIHQLNIDDFVVDEDTEIVQRCPAGREPVRSEHDSQTDTTTTEMAPEACGACEFLDECPVRRVREQYIVKHTGKERRLAARRREQATDAFRENYRIRAGIESTNGGMKRREGFGRVRARGRPRVFHKILMKAAGWNVLRAAASEKLRRKIAALMEELGHGSHFRLLRSVIGLLQRVRDRLGAFLDGLVVIDRREPRCSAA